jgi:hypothetical protein
MANRVAQIDHRDDLASADWLTPRMNAGAEGTRVIVSTRPISKTSAIGNPELLLAHDEAHPFRLGGLIFRRHHKRWSVKVKSRSVAAYEHDPDFSPTISWPG